MGKELQIRSVNNFHLWRTRLSGTTICSEVFFSLNVVPDRKIRTDLKLVRLFFSVYSI